MTEEKQKVNIRTKLARHKNIVETTFSAKKANKHKSDRNTPYEMSKYSRSSLKIEHLFVMW